MPNVSDFDEAVRSILLQFNFDSPTSCMIYTGIIDDGYGRVKIDGIMYRVNRLVAYYYLGLDLKDPKQFACHKCSNKACINPDHLYVGDNKSNQLDIVEDRCKKGHDLIEGNIYWHRRANGEYFRTCAICCRERAKNPKKNKTALKLVSGE